MNTKVAEEPKVEIPSLIDPFEMIEKVVKTKMPIYRSVDIPPWAEPEGMSTRAIALGYGAKDKEACWSSYSSNERAYINDVLPAVFKRTLVIDNIEGDRGIKWIFTGPRQGVYMELYNKTFRLSCKYYDSQGFNLGFDKLPKYSQFEHSINEITADKPITSVTIETDHKLNLCIALNGLMVIEQPFVDDLRRNQIHLLGTSGGLRARLLEPEQRRETLTVNPEVTYQKMLGWGGIATPTAYRELSDAGKAKWWEYISEYNLLCQREYPVAGRLHESLDNWDDLDFAKAHYYGDNFPNGEVADFDYNRRIQELGAFVIFEFWDFPAWIGDSEQQYTRAVVGYCREALRRTGKPPRIVGVQNEQEMSEATVKRFVPALRRALDEAGFEEVQIHMANAPYVVKGMEWLDRYRRNSEVWEVIDYSATNMYDYQQYFTNPDGFDATLEEWNHAAGSRPFLSTELCINNLLCQTDSYRIAFTMGQLYEKNLSIANAALIAYCWTIFNIEQSSFGASRSLFVSSPQDGFMPIPASKQLRVIGAYSRRIKEGMTRVDIKCANNDLKAVAFAGQDGLATIVVLNRSSTPIELNIDWSGAVFTETEIVDPYSNNRVQAINSSSMRIEPRSIVNCTNVALNGKGASQVSKV